MEVDAYMVMEYLPKGSLQHFLIRERNIAFEDLLIM